jgi:TatD DNase family protein
MQLIDAHCHLQAEEIAGDAETLIADAAAAGITRLITAATGPAGWEACRVLARRHDSVSFALGIHPWFVREDAEDRISELSGAREEGAVAIGEIGLDKKIEDPPMALQIRFFEAQLEIAKDLNLPVVIHCRGAFNELMRSLNRTGAPDCGGLVHAFSGSADIAEACMKHGLRFSMGAALSYKPSRKRREVLRRIWPDHLLLETDSPDMPPAQAPGKPNRPVNLLYNLRGAMQYLEAPPEEIAETTTRNAIALFRLES